MQTLNSYQVHYKEERYFRIKLFFTVLFYAVLGYGLYIGVAWLDFKILFFIGFYIALIALILLFRMGLLVGYLRGNAIKITKEQFPDIYRIAESQSSALGLTKVPEIYLLEAGGLLNAFATRFLGRNYVILYSDIFEEAYENNLESLEFIIGHELGHIKRNHINKELLLLPSAFVPFLSWAYSRGCEYTCDSIGAALSPKGATTGLLLLASGKKLYNKVNVKTFTQQNITEGGFWAWFAEKISTHPKLTKRVAVFQQQEFIAMTPTLKQETRTETKESKKIIEVESYDRYMPR
jgi:Zn-dependent protease with chaperone function